ncbi:MULTISPECIES: TRAP transporter small permease [Roseobacteraceae]|jgi:TRAP-type C4-dicarboxylate transport system permease small subunit|uniref:TRAP transporter small permease protein n=1 Tax=Pseudosulfitobacter pseudonitzschiae TaxID=1402135 RepID=A0A221K765_9RHOB|nr:MULTISPECIES: TRAP transporter small permease subunit [Roseobacteraceae]ASM74826.1 sialic acid TRAP transporter permease protein SiaT [Pseudosulfitobacter pseudonitzschiae]
MVDHKEKGAANAPFFPDRIVTGLVRFCGALSTALILVIFVQIVVAVIRRYLFDSPLQWSDEMIGYLLVTLIMLGSAEALRRGDHIAIDLVSAQLRPGTARVQMAAANLSVMAFAIIVGLSIWDSITFAHSFGSYSVGYIEIATWIPQVPVVLGMALLFLTAALGLYRIFRGLPQ